MNPASPTDPELLADWLDHRREAAFRELVARYAGLVQMTARRTSGDDSLATEAAQLTFITLAQKAKSLVSCASLGGWLHQTAMLQAKNLLRKSQREHRKRELLQTAMDTESPTSSPDAWQELQPVLDDALAALSAADREALLLRFYRSLSVREIAATLGIATDAAQKRIDRATDRLRGKLLRRGLTTGGSLSAVMLAGFAGDAQAAAFAVPLFTAKAIAAGAAGSGAFTATTAFLTASAMKTTSVVAPLIVLLAAGVWLAVRYQTLAGINRSNEELAAQIAAVQRENPMPDGARTLNSRTGLDTRRGAPDWKRLIGLMTDDINNFTNSGRPRALRVLEDRLAEMSKEEIAEELARIGELSLSTNESTALERFLVPLLLDKDTEMAFTWLIERPGEGLRQILDEKVTRWLEQDSTAAIAWLDRQIAAGKLEYRATEIHEALGEQRNRFEAIVLRHLLSADAAAASRRMAGIPADKRGLLLQCSEFWNLGNEGRVAAAKLAYQHLSADDQGKSLAVPVRMYASQGGYPQVDEYLDLIDAPAPVRAACAEKTALGMTAALAADHSVSRGEMDSMRHWVRSQAPDSVDQTTGKVLAEIAAVEYYSNEGTRPSTKTPFATAAELAAAFHDEGGGDEIIAEFLTNFEARRKKDLSRSLAEKLRDEDLRTKLTKRFK